MIHFQNIFCINYFKTACIYMLNTFLHKSSFTPFLFLLYYFLYHVFFLREFNSLFRFLKMNQDRQHNYRNDQYSRIIIRLSPKIQRFPDVVPTNRCGWASGSTGTTIKLLATGWIEARRPRCKSMHSFCSPIYARCPVRKSFLIAVSEYAKGV